MFYLSASRTENRQYEAFRDMGQDEIFAIMKYRAIFDFLALGKHVINYISIIINSYILYDQSNW